MGNVIQLPTEDICLGSQRLWSQSRDWICDRRRHLHSLFPLHEILIVRYPKDPSKTEPVEYYHVDDITEGALNLV